MNPDRVQASAERAHPPPPDAYAGTGGRGQVNPPLEAFLDAYAKAAADNRQLLEKLRVLLLRFQERGIDCMLLKGADLLTRVYGVYGLRSMTDVDLLIHKEDEPRIDRVARDLKLRPQPEGNLAYIDAENSFWVDMPAGIWYLENIREIWDRSVLRPVLGLQARCMEPVDLLIYLCAYTCLQRTYFTPYFAGDIALLLDREPIDWPRVVAEASRLGLRMPLYHALSFAIGRRRAKVPEEAMGALAPSTLRERLWLRFLRTFVTEERVPKIFHLTVLLTLPRGRRGSWLWSALFPDRRFLAHRYGRRTGLGLILTRLWRPLYMAARAVALSARIAGRLLIPSAPRRPLSKFSHVRPATDGDAAESLKPF